MKLLFPDVAMTILVLSLLVVQKIYYVVAYMADNNNYYVTKVGRSIKLITNHCLYLQVRVTGKT